MKILKFTNWLSFFILFIILPIQFVFANNRIEKHLKNNDGNKFSTFEIFNTSTPGLLQAENYTSVTGEVEIEPSTDSDGTSTVGYFDAGDVLHFNTSVNGTFNGKIRLRVASSPGGDLVVSTENGTLATVQIPSTGGWTNWSTEEIVVNYPISSQLNLTTTTGGVNVNWIEVIENDCPNPALSNLSITAETLTILPEQTIQLFTNGTDGCGNNMAVNPTWSSNAPNGVFTAGNNTSSAIVSATANGITASVTINIERPSKKFNFVVNEIGRLQASGNQIVDKNGQNVSLAGNSLFWSSAAPTWYSKETVEWLAENWETQVIRAALSVNPKDGAGQPWNTNDYVQSPEYSMGLMTEVINAAIENDIYVMVDFHEHYSNNYTSEAVTFFGDIAKQYNGYDNIIYEIWNEPINDSWSTVKAHAEVVIAEIRKYDPDNLIVVGTPFYSQRVDDAANNPIHDNNVAYALHGYAIEPAHGALRRGYSVPTVGSEWGIGINDNGGGETGAWVNYWRNQDGGKIHVMWAVNNKQEDGDQNWSILNSHVTAKGGWSDSDLSTSGHFQREVIRGWTNHVRTPLCTNEVLASIHLNASSTVATIGSNVTITASGVSTCDNPIAVNGTWSSNAPNGIYTASIAGVDTITYSENGIVETITITVLENQAPTVDAGENSIVIQSDSSGSLNGSASDPENDPITYSWTQLSGPKVVLIETPNALQSLVKGLSVLGTYVFELTASDPEKSSTDIVTINVVTNTPPSVDAGDNQVVGLGVSVVLSGTAVDQEGDNLSYSWSQISGPSSVNIANATSQIASVSGLDLGTYVFELAVNDGTSTVSDQINIDVIAEVEMLINSDFSNGAEGWTSFVFESATANNNIVNEQLESTQSYSGWEAWHVQFYQGNLKIENGQKYKLKFRAKAASFRDIYIGIEKNGDPYTGYAGKTIALSTDMQNFEYEFVMNQATDFNARVVFNMGNGYGDVYLDDVSLVNTTNVVENNIPIANAGNNQTLSIGTTTTTLSGSATDSDGPSTLTYSWTQTGGASVNISDASSSAPTISGLSDGGVYTFELVAFDGADNSAPSTVTITVESDIPNFTVRIEAENYSGMSGIQTESSTEGGLNVGYIDANDWMSYDNIILPQSGVYNVSYRVASELSSGRFKLEKAGGTVNYGELNVPSTGGWQNWTTISHEVNLEGGSQNFAIAAIAGGFNINWLEITLIGNSGARERTVTSLNLKDEITLYPNPATDRVFIKGLSNTTEKVDVFNIQGKHISSKVIKNTNNINLDITELKSGIYLIYVTDKKSISVKRFIKK